MVETIYDIIAMEMKRFICIYIFVIYYAFNSKETSTFNLSLWEESPDNPKVLRIFTGYHVNRFVSLTRFPGR